MHGYQPHATCHMLSAISYTLLLRPAEFHARGTNVNKVFNFYQDRLPRGQPVIKGPFRIAAFNPPVKLRFVVYFASHPIIASRRKSVRARIESEVASPFGGKFAMPDER